MTDNRLPDNLVGALGGALEEGWGVGKTGRANEGKRVYCQLRVGKRAHIPDGNNDMTLYTTQIYVLS